MLVRVGVLAFAVGLVAVGVIFALFAGGAHDLPLWLNLGAMLAPVGFGLALIGCSGRHGGRAEAERRCRPRAVLSHDDPARPARRGF